jgi:hypothetical protein
MAFCRPRCLSALFRMAGVCQHRSSGRHAILPQSLCGLAKVCRGHALGFGEDGFMKNWLVAISASTDPPGAERQLHDELLDVTGRGLRQSLLCQDQRVLAAVADWMSASLKESDGNV